MRNRLLAIVVLLGLFVAACGGSSGSSVAFADLPAGDASRGAELFTQGINGAPACATCHALDDQVIVGPGMLGYGARAGTRVEGQSAAEYSFNSITQPASHIVDGFGNTMYTQYGRQLSAQQIADLIAYLHTL